MRAALAVVILLGCALAAEGHPGNASAHGVLARSTPASNDVLSRSPSQVQLEFTEPVELSATRVRLFDGVGRQLAIGTPISANGGNTVDAALPTLPPGFYNVVWSNVSKVDGHAYHGSFPFTLLNPDGSIPAGQNSFSGFGSYDDPPPLAEGVAVRFLTLLGLVLALGPALILLIWYGMPTATANLLGRAMLGGGAVLALATLLNLQLLSDAFAGMSLTSLVFGTRSGLYWMSRISASFFIIALVGLSVASARVTAAMVLAAGAAYLLALSATSHAAASDGSRWAGAIDFAHGASAIGWIGAVVGLALAVRATSRDGDHARLMQRFSLLASVCVFVVVVTGLLSSLVQISEPSELLETRYGITVLVKLGAMAALFAAGLYNALKGRRLVAGGLVDGQRFVRTITLELALGLAVFVPAAMLTQTGVAKSVLQVPEASVFDRTIEADTHGMRLVIDPNRTGLNTFRVTVVWSPAELAADAVKLTFRYQDDQTIGPSTLSLDHGDHAGEFFGRGAFLNHEGLWRVEVEVRRAGADDIRAFYDVRPAGTAVTTFGRGGPWSNPAARLSPNQFAGLFAAFAGVGLLLWRRPLARLWPARIGRGRDSQ